MNQQMVTIAYRREHLAARSAAQRIAIAQNIEPLRRPLAIADQALGVLRYFRHHPALIVGGVVAIAALRPGRIGARLRRAWVAWQFIASLRRP